MVYKHNYCFRSIFWQRWGKSWISSKRNSKTIPSKRRDNRAKGRRLKEFSPPVLLLSLFDGVCPPTPVSSANWSRSCLGSSITSHCSGLGSRGLESTVWESQAYLTLSLQLLCSLHTWGCRWGAVGCKQFEPRCHSGRHPVPDSGEK